MWQRVRGTGLLVNQHVQALLLFGSMQVQFVDT